MDDNLVRELQLAVSGVLRSDTTVDSDNSETGKPARRDVEDEEVGDPGRLSELRTSGRRDTLSGHSRRTTLSVPHSVGKKARQLTMAITAAEQRDASLGHTLAWALDLLEAELKDKGVPIAAHPVRLRSGPRAG